MKALAIDIAAVKRLCGFTQPLWVLRMRCGEQTNKNVENINF